MKVNWSFKALGHLNPSLKQGFSAFVNTRFKMAGPLDGNSVPLALLFKGMK
jgi:hypothetical protein